MKKVSFSILLATALSLVGTRALAYDIAVENSDGVTIWYNYINNGTELEVTYEVLASNYNNCYNGALVIPEEVTYMNRTRKVTSIGIQAFYKCIYLESVIIPDCVTSIGTEAFSGCDRLISVTIGNGVTSIGSSAFSGCVNLASVTIPGSVISIESSTFSGCHGLISVTIDNGVTSIKSSAFYKCINLTSITIPNSIVSIGAVAFYNCSRLTSVTIPNSMTTIERGAFKGCTSLTSVAFPNSLTSIEDEAFFGCDIPEVISKIENPFAISTNTFSDNTFYNATLYVPAGTIDAYKATEGWQKFSFIEEENGGDMPEPQKCATPTITFVNGKVRFSCETEGVEFVPSVTSTPQQELNGNEMELGTTFTVSVYAVKEGYDNSDVATKTIDLSHVGDVNADGEVNVSDVTSLVSIILGSGNN